MALSHLSGLRLPGFVGCSLLIIIHSLNIIHQIFVVVYYMMDIVLSIGNKQRTKPIKFCSYRAYTVMENDTQYCE